MLLNMMQTRATDPAWLGDALYCLLVQNGSPNSSLSGRLFHFARTISEVAGAQATSIWSIDTNLNQLNLSAGCSDNKINCNPGSVIHFDSDGEVLKVLRSKKIVAINNIDEPVGPLATIAEVFQQTGANAVLCCPLFDNDDLLGVLIVQHAPASHVWTDNEKRFAEAAVSLISMAMVQATNESENRATTNHKLRLGLFARMADDRLWETDDALNIVSVVSGTTILAPEETTLIGRRPWDVPTRQPLLGGWGPIKQSMENHEVIKDLILVDTNLDGTKSYREASGEPQFDQNGLFTGYIGVTRDVTNKMAREAELQATDQRYRNASRLACLGHWVWDRDKDCCTYCSPEMADIFGVTVEEYVARTNSFEQDQKWYHPDDREEYVAALENACATDSGWTISTRIIRDDGSIRHLKQWAEPGYDSTGRLTSTLGVLMDVTDQIDLGEKLRISRSKLSNLVDNLPGALFRVKLDEKWSAVYRSQGFYRHFVDPTSSANGWDELGEDNWLLQVEEADRKRVRQVVEAAAAAGSTYEVEYSITTVNGDKRWVWERGNPVTSTSGEVEIEGIMIDATDKRRAEEALIKSQRGEAIGQMTGGVAHDFNNLLAIILGNLELVRDDISDVELRKMLDASISATTRGADLTRNMLAFARQAKLEPTKLNLNEVVRNAQNWIGRTLPSNIEVNTQLDVDLWSTQADLSSTESVLLNLIINARDAMQQGGELTIETKNLVVDAQMVQNQHADIDQGDYVTIAVSDTGHGIPKKLLKQIFEPFFTTKAPGAGSGLGLSMIYGFIRQSGGTVRVYSEEGVGTTFKLFFRALPQDQQAEDQSTIAGQPITPRCARILIAEDESGVLAVLVSALRKAGYKVTACDSGDAAKAVFEADPNFDLLITDVVMPGRLLGPNLVEELRVIRPDLPAIFLTGYAAETTIHGNELHPEDIRLMKPIRRAELLASISKVLQARDARSETS
ncbi:PAS domain-containing protein [Parasedimentitalea maritima]|uniref:histidine kinase n=2 Tax=Parasedimentitalea maritima TaxID=2578117 RepID=A0A6A4RB15_9RHOB|nr:PAS domain-containing protein [Zongyanglinia marina]